MLNNIIHLYRKSGFLLTLLRFPFRTKNKLLRSFSSFYWRFFISDIGKKVIIEWGVSFELPSNVKIGDNVYIGKNVNFGSEVLNGMLVIEDSVQISEGCTIDHTGDVTIKENTLLSKDVVIFSHSHGTNPRSEAKQKKLVIGANCWLGFRSIIMESTGNIASGVIIATNSVTTKPCDSSYSIYGGIPAKYIKKIDLKDKKLGLKRTEF